MKFRETDIGGVFVIDLERRDDERGFFARSWCAREFRDHGLSTDVVQCNVSFNKRRGTLRGLHYQTAPHEEVKLVRCTAGAIFDVAVDLRPQSPTYTSWVGVELTAENHRMLYVPGGLAHGYLTLADASEVVYQVSAFHAPEAEGGVRWDDPAFAIAWPTTEKRIISKKDASWPDFRPSFGAAG